MSRCKLVIVLFILVLAGCSESELLAPPPPVGPAVQLETATWTPAPTTPAPSPVPSLVPTPTPAPLRVFVPAAVLAYVQPSLVQAPPGRVTLVESSLEADVQVVVVQAGRPLENLAATWVYALVAPFPSLVDEVPFAQVQAAWFGSPSPLLPGPLHVSQETYAAFVAAWGEPPAGAVAVLPQGELVDALWAARPYAWGIVPFEQLSPSLKVLAVGGQTPLQRNLDVASYPLALAVGWAGSWPELRPAALTNRDESKMTLLAMTGVTALTRTTAWKMERNGVLYPAEKIRAWLTGADIVHISNEVSFWEACPPPQVTGMEFCSAPKYVQIITDVHASVIELTGNHLNDFGWEPLSYTLALYDQLGLPYYGGGRTITEAQRALTLTHNGNVLGFVGCNPVGPPIGWVDGLRDGRPGAAPCDDAVLQAELQKLRASGALPIATLQYWEFYEYPPTRQQVDDFRQLVDFGAAIVSGSQGHHPQGFDLYNGAFIHYGVGNLFFGDQYDPNTRKTFVDRYLIYENRLLSVELLTAQIEDYSQPRPMTPDERSALLQAVFAASGW